jgi:hypothetical protein
MPPFSGPLPPSLTGAPPGAGPGVPPAGTPGNTTASLGDIRIAVEALQKALPAIPMGTELHQAVAEAIKKISSHLGDMQDSGQMRMQNLMAMLQRARQAQPNQALAALGPKPGGGAPPVLTPPGGGGAAPPGGAAMAA